MFRPSRRYRVTSVPQQQVVEVFEQRQLLAATGLEGRLTGTDALANAEFKVEDGLRKFEINVLSGAAGRYDVRVAGQLVGTVDVSSAGLGNLTFSDRPRGEKLPFPSNWPEIAAGTEVRIEGLASGSLRERGNDDTVVSSHFFVLSGGAGQTGFAQFEVESEGGVERREFELEAYNLQPLTAYPVVVDGITVATATSSSLGVLKLRYSDKVRPDAVAFPANFPAMTGTSTVQLGHASSPVSSTPGVRPDDRGTDDGVTHLRIALVGAGTEAGAASFESIPAQGGAAALREFKVEIWNAAPGAVLAIQVGGVNVGTITPNARGFGRLAFETDDNAKPFPTNWPGISEGTVVQVGTILSGVFTGTGAAADPSNQNSDDAYQLDRTLQLSLPTSYFENFGGRGEKWLKGKGTQWYFITPSGALYRWDGKAGANGTLITVLDPAFHEKPELLHEAKAVRDLALDDDLLRATAAELDSELGLVSSSTTYEDWGGKSERWIKGTKGWYFITPDGTLTKWNGRSGANGDVVARFDSRFHEDLTLLTSATQKLSNTEKANALDLGFKLFSTPNNFFNWGGRQEKWVTGDGRWYFITPNGQFYRWDGRAGANGTLLTSLSVDFYNDLTLLTNSGATGTVASRAILDDLFIDNPLL